MQLAVEDEGELPGLEDVVAGLDIDETDPKALDDAVAAIGEAELPLRATMGVRDSLSSWIQRIRAQHLVRELPETTVALPWFECHVPHSGTAEVRVEASQAGERSAALRIFGSGVGRGRSLKLTITQESDPRSACAIYLVHVRVVPKLYELNGEESLVGEIVGEAGVETKTVDVCPACTVAPEQLDPFEVKLEPFHDYRKDAVHHRETIRLDWSGKETIDVGAKIPKLDVELSLTAAASSDAVWEVEYGFAPGFFYQPYRLLEGMAFEPPRWAFK